MKTTVAGCIFAAFMALFLSAAESGQTSPVPISDLGVQAAKHYSGEGISVTLTPGGALLRSAFQDLEADATAEGLWLRSGRSGTGEGGDRFRVRAIASGRDGAAVRSLRPQASCGWRKPPSRSSAPALSRNTR